MANQIKVVVVDDSPLMRMMICKMLSTDENIKVIGSAQDGFDAIEKVKKLHPDVVTMDIEMPELDGIQALRIIMRDQPTRIVMLSGIDRPGLAYDALRFGAVDFIGKPSGPVSYDLKAITEELVGKIRAAARADLQTLASGPRAGQIRVGKVRVKAVMSLFSKAVVVGSSTGGPQALERFFNYLPEDFPAAILIVQHLPAGYSQSLAERLTRLSRIPVQEAHDGQMILAGHAFIAPGNRHMTVVRERDGGLAIKLDSGPLVNHVRPAVDKLMISVAETYGKRCVGVIMSGMGSDGAVGMERIKQVGGRTIVQDKQTSIVFGMPGAAIRRGFADRVMPIDDMATAVMEALADTEGEHGKSRIPKGVCN